jgi:hypothetical protein
VLADLGYSSAQIDHALRLRAAHQATPASPSANPGDTGASNARVRLEGDSRSWAR